MAADDFNRSFGDLKMFREEFDERRVGFAVSTHIKAILRKLQSEAKRLGKPIYFISNAFDLPNLKPEKKLSSFYLYKIDVV